MYMCRCCKGCMRYLPDSSLCWHLWHLNSSTRCSQIKDVCLLVSKKNVFWIFLVSYVLHVYTIFYPLKLKPARLNTRAGRQRQFALCRDWVLLLRWAAGLGARKHLETAVEMAVRWLQSGRVPHELTWLEGTKMPGATNSSTPGFPVF